TDPPLQRIARRRIARLPARDEPTPVARNRQANRSLPRTYREGASAAPRRHEVHCLQHTRGTDRGSIPRFERTGLQYVFRVALSPPLFAAASRRAARCATKERHWTSCCARNRRISDSRSRLAL